MPAANVLIRFSDTALKPDDIRYLRQQARERDISVTSLVRRLVEAATVLQIIPGILDDEGKEPLPCETVGRPRTRPVTLPTSKLAGQPLGD